VPHTPRLFIYFSLSSWVLPFSFVAHAHASSPRLPFAECDCWNRISRGRKVKGVMMDDATHLGLSKLGCVSKHTLARLQETKHIHVETSTSPLEICEHTTELASPHQFQS
jgi:hypothetical protein